MRLIYEKTPSGSRCVRVIEKRDFPLEVNFPVCLAPMVGLSHIGLRQVIREYMPRGSKTIWPSEMLNSRRLPHETLSKVPEALHDEEESFWVPQILGNEADPIAESLKKLEDYGAHGVDINMGCPVKKALKHNYGVALMGDAGYAAKVVEMTTKNTQLPVSVKLRAGFDNDPKKLFSFVKGLENSGASWITLHPRTAEQKRRGEADWNQVKWLREELKIPVIGNGDVQVAEDVIRYMEQTHCDMVMVGRALTARPWLMWQVGEKLGLPAPEGKEGRAPQTPEEEAVEYGRVCRRLLELMSERFRPTLARTKFVFFIKTSCVWLDFGHQLYGKVTGCKDLDKMPEVLEKFFQSQLRMVKKTDLRE